MLTHRKIEGFNQFLTKMAGAYFTSTDQTEQAGNKAAAADLVEKVRLHTRYAYGIARNQRIIEGVIKSMSDALKNEKLEAWQKAHQALVAEKLDAEKMEKRYTALKMEHDVDNLIAEANRRHNELMELEVLADDGTPLKLYRILVTDLPGWNDPADAPGDKRNGIVTPIDIAFLFDIGVLFDPSDAEAAKPAGPAN